MSTRTNLVNSVDAKSSRKRGLTFTADQLRQWHVVERRTIASIAGEYGVSAAAICYWFNKLDVQHRKKLREVLFEPSPAFSYVIGCLLGDGCVVERRHQIRLAVSDEIFARSFCSAIRLLGLSCGVAYIKSVNANHNGRFLAYSYSKNFYEWWSKIGRIGAAEYACAFPADFVRGFYESEGSIKSHRGNLEISMTNTDYHLIKVVCKCIPSGIKYSFAGYGPYSHGTKRRWDISITNGLDVMRFLAWSMPCMKRAPRGQANTEPILIGNVEAGVENTKTIQNGRRVGNYRVIDSSQPQAANPRLKMYSDLAGNSERLAEMSNLHESA